VDEEIEARLGELEARVQALMEAHALSAHAYNALAHAQDRIHRAHMWALVAYLVLWLVTVINVGIYAWRHW